MDHLLLCNRKNTVKLYLPGFFDTQLFTVSIDLHPIDHRYWLSDSRLAILGSTYSCWIFVWKSARPFAGKERLKEDRFKYENLIVHEAV